jgi:hypothetical protein
MEKTQNNDGETTTLPMLKHETTMVKTRNNDGEHTKQQ